MLLILSVYLLFLLHINDLPSCVNSKVRLFADDCLLYREIKNNQDQIDMQRDLDALMDCRVGVKYSTCTWYLYLSTYLSVLDVLENLVYGNAKVLVLVLVLDQKVLGTYK